jgi:hypothetical protein
MADAGLKRFRMPLGVAFLVAAIAAIGHAMIPDAGGVIHGCYANGGALRVIDESGGEVCKNGETALFWNQTGPQGPQGTPGQQGPQGTPAIGDAYHTKGPRVDFPASQSTEINRLQNVPAGNYFVTTHISVLNEDSPVTCSLHVNNQQILPIGTTTVYSDRGSDVYGLVSMTTTVVAGQASNVIRTTCGASDSGSAAGELVAMKIGGTIHFQ